MSGDVSLRPGDLLGGKYRVDRVLGQGGMGMVVAATHKQLGHQVALKFLLPAALLKPEFVERFLREAKAAVAIRSEHVARVLDVGEFESGAPFMVMEYLQGHDLGEELRQRGPLPIERAVDYLLQAGEALAEAHSLGIVHRDLKPTNLFLTRRADGSPLVKVLDFGIAKFVDTSSPEALTKTTAVMGSPLYRSPEQVRSTKAVDARSDLWSLGVVLQELVTGRPSFDAETVSGLMAMIAADAPTPLRTLRPDAPEALERLVARCLEKRPEERMPSMAALAQALYPFASERGRLSVQRIVDTMRGSASTALRSQPPPAPPMAAEPGSQPTRKTDGTWGQTHATAPAPRRRLVPVVAVAGVSALVVAAVGVALTSRSAPNGPPGAAPAATASEAQEPASEPSAKAPVDEPAAAPAPSTSHVPAPSATAAAAAPPQLPATPPPGAAPRAAPPGPRPATRAQPVEAAPKSPAPGDELKTATGSRK
ncbi:MAG: serine/threonine protein kinase [Polyangiaceae bacterium]|nr:serine/threonine protein kinase [Polyangiaceae bacterium]